MTAFDAYRKFLALKFHFSGTFIGDHRGGSYDYFKHKGKLSRFKQESFNKRGDKHIFEKLVNKLSDEQIIEYFLANFIRGNQWITQFDQKSWKEHKKLHQSIEYNFINDAEKLLTLEPKFDIIFNCDEGNHPKLLKAYFGKKINLETLVIFEKLLHYRKRFDIEITEMYVWPRISRLISRYEPFVEVDIGKCKQMLLEKATELRNE